MGVIGMPVTPIMIASIIVTISYFLLHQSPCLWGSWFFLSGRCGHVSPALNLGSSVLDRGRRDITFLLYGRRPESGGVSSSGEGHTAGL